MGKRGPKRQYTIKREAYLTLELDAVLDRLRGNIPRSEYIRRLIQFVGEFKDTSGVMAFLPRSKGT